MGRWSYYTKKFAYRWAREVASREKPIVIALDAMGGDHGTEVTLEGALNAVAEQENLKILLIGKKDELTEKLGNKFLPEEIEILNSDDAFGMDESPTAALRRPNCSIMMGVDLVATGEADGFVSMGNTGAVMASALVKIGRIPGVERPALMTLFPTIEGRPTLVVDIGANVDCKPINLLRFGQMASLYAKEVLDRSNPKVALLSVGEEDSKGNTLTKATNKLLRESNLDFIGNVEGGAILTGEADVIVTDGFAGNVLLKFGEGSMGFFKSIAKKGRRNNLFTLARGLLIKGHFRKIMKEFDYAEYGGAPLLGIKGNIVIGHGKSSIAAVTNAISLASVMAFADIAGVIEDYIKGKVRKDENEDIGDRIESTGSSID
ncbi:phosphate acyltransferase PlsX [bacterium]|nr:phosphate acyltransferase PlsX [bacterium]